MVLQPVEKYMNLCMKRRNHMWEYLHVNFNLHILKHFCCCWGEHLGPIGRPLKKHIVPQIALAIGVLTVLVKGP